MVEQPKFKSTGGFYHSSVSPCMLYMKYLPSFSRCNRSPVSPCRGERRVQPPSEVGVLRAGAEHEAQGEVGDDGQGQRVEGRQGDLKEQKLTG